MSLIRVYVPLLLIAFVGRAAVMPRYTLNELATHSETIVEGRITRAWTAWDSKHKYIWTHYEVQAAEFLKGAPSRTVVVSEPGGSIDGARQLFSGQVPYSPGEHVVLFLYRTPAGYFRTRGGLQGKIALQNGLSADPLKTRIGKILMQENH